MEKLAEDIWKAIWCSLAASVAIVGFLRYFDQEHWWQTEINFRPEEYENDSIVYYSIKNTEEEKKAAADLFINNIPQEETWGEHGVFENILPGQIISIRVKYGDLSILSPVFRLQEGEIRHLVFEVNGDKMAYLGNNSRIRKITTSKIAVFCPTNGQNLSQLGILKEIEKYKPLHTAAAKEEADEENKEIIEKEEVKSLGELTSHKSFFISPLLYSQSFQVHRSISE